MIQPEFRCPECKSTRLRITFNSMVTYEQRKDGSREIVETEDESVFDINCKDCGHEFDGDEDWKNKEK